MHDEYFREPCGIPGDSPDTVIVTGGNTFWGAKTVEVYNVRTGFVKSLPDLNEKRYAHGCSSYYRDTEQVCKTNYRVSETYWTHEDLHKSILKAFFQLIPLLITL